MKLLVVCYTMIHALPVLTDTEVESLGFIPFSLPELPSNLKEKLIADANELWNGNAVEDTDHIMAAQIYVNNKDLDLKSTDIRKRSHKAIKLLSNRALDVENQSKQVLGRLPERHEFYTEYNLLGYQLNDSETANQVVKKPLGIAVKMCRLEAMVYVAESKMNGYERWLQHNPSLFRRILALNEDGRQDTSSFRK